MASPLGSAIHLEQRQDGENEEIPTSDPQDLSDFLQDAIAHNEIVVVEPIGADGRFTLRQHTRENCCQVKVCAWGSCHTFRRLMQMTNDQHHLDYCSLISGVGLTESVTIAAVNHRNQKMKLVKEIAAYFLSVNATRLTSIIYHKHPLSPK
ncbi:hypothetical protein Pcinc_006874 [Petrolisthes cinctipes]|uniref:Uncharacterized protein n=1 Tax=Petrolisthes cinctipes TaxID=88211 RepID=A0AAE1KZ72_PETCI|nr:hypothetical protein Pcinc_006874 [Petrolisthes cinctipes]